LPPVIFITAFDSPEARAQALAAGAAAFLTKPFSGRTLLETVRRVTKAAAPTTGGADASARSRNG
jgi:DNA-binding response OmpR family regulator